MLTAACFAVEEVVLKIFALKNEDDASMNEIAVCQKCLAQESDGIEDLYAA